MVRRPRCLRAVAALIVAALAAAACSSGHDQGSVSTSSSSSTTTTTSSSVPTTTTTVDVFALRPPTAAGDPAALAAQIADAERALRDPATAEADVAAAALAQQVAYRQLGDHPEWDAAVIPALPAEVQPSAASHAAARRELRALSGAPRTTLPAWRIVAPAPLADLQKDYEAAGAAFGIPWGYLAAINLVETGIGRIRGTSEAGAQGPMQFLPATWAAYGAGGDINDPHDAIFAAARLLAADGAPADMAGALYGYNHSDHYVQAITRYAELIDQHPLTLRAIYHWGIYYRTIHGDVYLPVGYEQTAPVPAP